MEATAPPSRPEYETRRRHIRAILYGIETDIRTVVKWTGRETVGEYRYVWQIVNDQKKCRSEAVLDDLESALREKGYWIPYGKLDVSSGAEPATAQ